MRGVWTEKRDIMSLMRSVFFIVNPHAGGGSVGRRWARIQKQVRHILGPFRFGLTSGPGDATRLARQAILEGAELVVCVGGDGTLNEVVTGMMDGPGPLRPGALLGLISLGTGRDFIRSSQIPRRPEEALEVILAGRSAPLDLGRISYVNHQGQQTSRYFHNVASFGLGGEVDERVSSTTKVFGGFASFVWATLLSALSYGKKTISLKIDDSPEER
jgi:diacylglycerol kinase family enzyme